MPPYGWLVGWLGFNGAFNTIQVISNITIIVIILICLFQAARPIKPHTQTYKEEQTAIYKKNNIYKKKKLRKKLKNGKFRLNE